MPPHSNPSIHFCSLALCGESAVTVCPSSCGPSCLSQMGPSPPHPPWAMMSIRGRGGSEPEMTADWPWSVEISPSQNNMGRKKNVYGATLHGRAQIYKALFIILECKYFFLRWLSFDLQQLHSVRFTGLLEPENCSFLCAIVRVIIRVHAQRLVGRGSAC